MESQESLKIKNWADFEDAWKGAKYDEQKLGVLKGWSKCGVGRYIGGKDLQKMVDLHSVIAHKYGAGRSVHSFPSDLKEMIYLAAIQSMLSLVEGKIEWMEEGDATKVLRSFLYPAVDGGTFFKYEPHTRKVSGFLREYGWRFVERLPVEWYDLCVMTRSFELMHAVSSKNDSSLLAAKRLWKIFSKDPVMGLRRNLCYGLDNAFNLEFGGYNAEICGALMLLLAKAGKLDDVPCAEFLEE